MKGIKWSRACMPWLLLMRCVAPVTSWDYCMIYIIPTVTKLEWAERQVRESVCVNERGFWTAYLYVSVCLSSLLSCSPRPEAEVPSSAMAHRRHHHLWVLYCKCCMSGDFEERVLVGDAGRFPNKELTVWNPRLIQKIWEYSFPERQRFKYLSLFFLS